MGRKLLMTSNDAARGRRLGALLSRPFLLLLLSALTAPPPTTTPTAALALSPSSSFHGSSVRSATTGGGRSRDGGGCLLVMRKQKASDKRTARMQRGIIGDGNDSAASSSSSAFAPPPLAPSSSTSTSAAATRVLSSSVTKGRWKQRKVEPRSASGGAGVRAGDNGGGYNGRGRARKRLRLYNSLASYHSTFLELISEEYRLEEAEVIARLDSSIADPFLLERSGHALFDVHPQRRGNLFGDEVYRLEKSADATTTFFCVGGGGDDSGNDSRFNGSSSSSNNNKSGVGTTSPLPPNHKFARNDVVVMTRQPRGTGDFLGAASLPTNADADAVEARVLNVGPHYLDVAVPPGRFESSFGPASNDRDRRDGDPSLRVRVDRFLSDVPFRRMVAAVGQLTSVPDRPARGDEQALRVGGFRMDGLLKDAVLSTFAIKDDGALDEGMSNPTLGDLPKKLARPPLPASSRLADEVMAFIDANPSKLFPKYNEPQLTAIRAALTRRLTLIQGPPGTGKTTTAGSIAFGFVHQCRSLSPNCKVLATAFSNVGADNLAEKFLSLGLKVVRVGKPSGVSEGLWSHTLDAAIQRDPNAQRALEDAAKATAALKLSGGKVEGKGKGRANKGSIAAERAKRDAATDAVKASIQACNVAATRALRAADVIVATSVGAADAQLLAACGIYPEEEDDATAKKRRAAVDARPKTQFGTVREFAPDNLPPLTTPFVIIDEACQSVEPASLIPIVSTDSCRALVMLGDPCQLPPTVRSDASSMGESALSVSLMSRLASALPQPVTVTAQKDTTPLETKFLNCQPTRQAVSKVAADSSGHEISYRKQYSGSLLLSVQYRMHPSIAAFSSAIFYNGLLASPNVLSGLRKFPTHLNSIYPPSNSEVSVRFVHVGGRGNERKGAVLDSTADFPTSMSVSDPSNSSFRNDEEAKQVIDMLKSLLKEDAPSNGSIGVVTPYSSQVALIKSMMAKDEVFRNIAQSYPHDIEVKSVDAYQGRERDLIIFSAVRSNRHGRIGFLKDWRRMNVALTRAKNGLIVLGDAETLKEGDKHWASFIHWCDKMGCFVESAPTQ